MRRKLRVDCNLLLRSGNAMDDMPERVFKANYGVSKECVQTLFELATSVDESMKINFILWLFYFLKNYTSLDVCATHFGVTAKTFGKHLWETIFLLHAIVKTVRTLNLFSY